MAERAYELESAQVLNFGPAEFTLLVADVDGETLVVELVNFNPHILAGYEIRRYVGGVLVFAWPTPLIAANGTYQLKGPWVLIGSSTAPQELRAISTGASIAVIPIEYSRE